METLSFAFGVLAMIAIILIIVVVVGIVKVYKQQNEIRSIELWIQDVERNFRSEYDTCMRTIESERKSLDDKINETTSYIDSRIDKLQTKLTEKGSKELLKG